MKQLDEDSQRAWKPNPLRVLDSKNPEYHRPCWAPHRNWLII